MDVGFFLVMLAISINGWEILNLTADFTEILLLKKMPFFFGWKLTIEVRCHVKMIKTFSFLYC